MFVSSSVQCKEKKSSKSVSVIGNKAVEKQNTENGITLDKFGDFDGDGIINLYDLCPCEKGEKTNTGCPDERTNLKIA